MLGKKMSWIWMPVLAVALMFLGGCRHPTPEKMADRVVDELTSELELNASQQQQLRAIKGELLAKVAEMKKNREGMRNTLATELQKDVLDRNALKGMVDTRKAQIEAISDLMIERLAQFHSTLSSEQKKKLVQYLQKKEKRHKRCSFGS